ncbi:protein da1-related 1, partial [Quercus suber]
IPKIQQVLIECRERPFWKQQFCPSHEHDRTPQCCSCERMETRDRKYLLLDDGRKLCLECLDSAVMDTNECQPLYIEIQNSSKEIPMFLVERQALNVAWTEKMRPRMVDNQIIDVETEPRRLIRRCEVTAILVLYGLPRLLTGSILAHEMMHAWLRLKGLSSYHSPIDI